MERLSDLDGAFPQACFACPARIYIDGGYSCNPEMFDDKSERLDVARYRPIKCPKNVQETRNDALSAETLLRKILRK